MKKEVIKAIDIAKKLNTIENINRLKIPILDGFELLEHDKTSKIIFIAKKDNIIEQFLTDGALIDDETIDERIDKIILEITKEVGTKPLYKKGTIMKFLKLYSNEGIDYHIYVQDILKGTPSDRKLIRQLNAYFVEPVGKEFCQMSLATGLYPVGERFKLLKDIKDLKNDELTKTLEIGLDIILKNIKYKDK